MKKLLLTSIISSLLIGCGSGSSSDSSVNAVKQPSKNIDEDKTITQTILPPYETIDQLEVVVPEAITKPEVTVVPEKVVVNPEEVVTEQVIVVSPGEIIVDLKKYKITHLADSMSVNPLANISKLLDIDVSESPEGKKFKGELYRQYVSMISSLRGIDLDELNSARKTASDNKNSSIYDGYYCSEIGSSKTNNEALVEQVIIPEHTYCVSKSIFSDDIRFNTHDNNEICAFNGKYKICSTDNPAKVNVNYDSTSFDFSDTFSFTSSTIEIGNNFSRYKIDRNGTVFFGWTFDYKAVGHIEETDNGLKFVSH